MDQNDNEECIIVFPETYAYGVYGPLQSLPRVGEDYQIEIPPLITDSDYLDYIKNPIVEEETNEVLPSNFLIGLDIPIVWIYHEPQNVKNDNVVSLVPGYALESWNELERDSFLLGLYIFEKDFAQLKRFIESKTTGDISSYYYGSFYRSDEYRRWSECRKSRGRRCILGKNIFSGLRQQEFIARLVPHVSEECYNSLMEVSRMFGDAKIELEYYVFTIKTLIGINMFIETVAIGKGKQDLTGNAIEPTKENQAIHIRPEIPIGKACSTLTKAEIIEFLTGDYRLSKARSSDLFWEAVWPRLLARGWHSEEPDGYSFAANKRQLLVFLMPGVQKFSRSLVKGETYFDSVTDILNKVAYEPQLIKLDNEENGETITNFEGKEEKENGFLEKRKSHCYLQPRAQKYGKRVVVKFTVVDTSLIGGKIVRVRESETMKWDSDEFHIELLAGDESDSEYVLLEDEEKPVKKQKIKHLEANRSDYIPPDATKVRKSKQENLGHRAKKCRRLTACSRVDSKAGSSLDSHVGSSSQANHKLSSNLSFTSRCSSIDTVEEQRMNLIDLNFPVPPEFGNGEFEVEVNDERKECRPKKLKEQENGDSGSRRQSTRNRPPTVKALEAIANGFFTVNSRKKDKEDNFRDSLSVPRSEKVQVSRGEVWPVSECSTGDASSGVKGDDEDGEIEK